MVQIRNIKDIEVQLWRDKNFVGMVSTYLQFLDVRLQIKEANLSGYMLWIKDVDHPDNHGIWVPIQPDGKIQFRPKGMFDRVEGYLTQLL